MTVLNNHMTNFEFNKMSKHDFTEKLYIENLKAIQCMIKNVSLY
jgi:hypothetical protein